MDVEWTDRDDIASLFNHLLSKLAFHVSEGDLPAKDFHALAETFAGTVRPDLTELQGQRVCVAVAVHTAFVLDQDADRTAALRAAYAWYEQPTDENRAAVQAEGKPVERALSTHLNKTMPAMEAAFLRGEEPREDRRSFATHLVLDGALKPYEIMTAPDPYFTSLYTASAISEATESFWSQLWDRGDLHPARAFTEVPAVALAEYLRAVEYVTAESARIDEAWDHIAAATADLPDEAATVAPGELVDSDGYPTEEALEHLRRFTGTPAEYVAYAESLFVNGAGVQVEDLNGRWDRGMKRVSFVTGGWSGCESVISAIEGSMFSFRFAREWKSGGYWAYEIHSSQWDETSSFLGKMWVLAEEKNPDRGMYPERLRTVDTGRLRHIIDLIDNDQLVLARQRLVELTMKAEKA